VKVAFTKTGERRYGVFVDREYAPAMMMHPAPKFDEFLPHDLLHFVAEAEWGLDGAVFGQLAAGGDAGTFWAAYPKRVRALGAARSSGGWAARAAGGPSCSPACSSAPGTRGTGGRRCRAIGTIGSPRRA
jgi:hypothetical protein